MQEFLEQVGKITNMLGNNASCISGSATDDVDISVLTTDAATLGASAFLSENTWIPASRIAYKDAYDYVRSHARLGQIYASSRSTYYGAAGAEYSLGVQRAEHFKAVLSNLAKAGEATQQFRKSVSK